MTLHYKQQHNSADVLQEWLEAKEGEHFEFKEAKEHYPFEKLAKYCCALSNAGGGKITDAIVTPAIFGTPNRINRLRFVKKTYFLYISTLI